VETSTETIVAYIAGFFDGEGSIFISKGTHQYFLCVNISNTNLSILEDINKITGLGSVSESHDARKNSSKLFRIRFYCNEAKAFLEQVYPFLRIKKAQAELAIEFQSKMKNGKLTMRIGEKEDYKRKISSFSSRKGGFKMSTENAGRTLVKVNPRGTSKEYKHGELDRDYNAALNVLERGLAGLGRPSVPVEVKPLLPVAASDIVEAGSSMRSVG